MDGSGNGSLFMHSSASFLSLSISFFAICHLPAPRHLNFHLIIICCCCCCCFFFFFLQIFQDTLMLTAEISPCGKFLHRKVWKFWNFFFLLFFHEWDGMITGWLFVLIWWSGPFWYIHGIICNSPPPPDISMSATSLPIGEGVDVVKRNRDELLFFSLSFGQSGLVGY